MKKQSNILYETDVLDYYSFPALSPDVLKALSLRAFRLYHVLLEAMKNRRNTCVQLTAEQVHERTGIFKQDQSKARQELQRHGLIATTKAGTRLEYTLLNPAKSTPVRYLSYLSDDTLTREQVESYFLHRLNELGAGDRIESTTNGYTLSRCPWCDKRRTLQIKLPSSGELGSGLWTCKGCEADAATVHGGAIVQFEVKILLRQPFWRGRTVEEVKRAARRGVEAFLQHREQDENEQEREPEEQDLNDW